jgi:hypothetical protein
MQYESSIQICNFLDISGYDNHDLDTTNHTLREDNSYECNCYLYSVGGKVRSLI